MSRLFSKFLKIFGNGDVTGRRNDGMPEWKIFLRAARRNAAANEGDSMQDVVAPMALSHPSLGPSPQDADDPGNPSADSAIQSCQEGLIPNMPLIEINTVPAQ